MRFNFLLNQACEFLVYRDNPFNNKKIALSKMILLDSVQHSSD